MKKVPDTELRVTIFSHPDRAAVFLVGPWDGLHDAKIGDRMELVVSGIERKTTVERK